MPMMGRLQARKNRPRATATGAGGGGSVLTAADFTYLGHYILTNAVGEGIAFGAPITHRYVGGELRFLITAFNGGANDVVEFAIPAGAYGQTISTRTRLWAGNQVWGGFFSASILQGWHHGFHAEDVGGNTRLWLTAGIDYPGAGYANMTCGVAVCQLNDNQTVSGANGMWGFQGVGHRCIMGKVLKNPAWFQSAYGVGPYLYCGGSYVSLLGQGGAGCLGLFTLAGPDVTGTSSRGTYPIPGYADLGDDWTSATGTFKILSDFRSGIGETDWYTSPGNAGSFDRGRRLNAVANYFEGGGQAANLSGTATWTNGSATVTFSQSQTLTAGEWIGPNDQTYGVIQGAAHQVLASNVNGTTATLNAVWPLATVTAVCSRYQRPPGSPQAAPTGNWLTPAPDGYGRWVWGDSYFSTQQWIDGPTKQGLVAVFAGAGGKAWYHAPGNFIGSDTGVAEIHVFSPASLGAVALGSANAWSVQPSDMKDITGDMTANGICTLSHGVENGGPSGATYDPTTKKLWVFSPGIDGAFGGGGYSCLLSCYAVNC